MSNSAPTNSELKILKQLWRGGPLTAGALHEQLNPNSEVVYTTTLKLLQNMLAKGLVKRNEDFRQHTYRSAVPEERTLNGVVRRWVDTVFNGSAVDLAMRALKLKRVTKEELSTLREFVSRWNIVPQRGKKV
jgi:BlaI family penicillinase repressor